MYVHLHCDLLETIHEYQRMHTLMLGCLPMHVLP